jgi:2-methylisocitrate lyase-like PEP mutase family enzyme
MLGVFSAAVKGLNAYPIEVDVNSGFGESLTVIVGNVALYLKRFLTGLLQFFLRM